MEVILVLLGFCLLFFVWLFGLILGWNKELPKKKRIIGKIMMFGSVTIVMLAFVSCVRSCDSTTHESEFDPWTGERKPEYIIRDIERMRRGH